MTASTSVTLISGSYTSGSAQPDHFRVTYRQPITFAATRLVDHLPPVRFTVTSSVDADGDSLSNLNEYRNGTDPPPPG